MKTQFDTEKEAQTALKNAREESLGWCPVIKETCARGCICYYKGNIYETSGINKRTDGFNWRVHYPGCTNVLISGVITVES